MRALPGFTKPIPRPARRPADGGRLLGACAPQNLRRPCRDEIARGGAGARNDRAAVCDRSRDQRQAARRARRRAPREAAPVLAELRAFLDATMAKISGKSSFAGAIRYAVSRWTALTRYVDDGRLEMSNNAAERAIRPLAMRESLCAPSSSICKHWKRVRVEGDTDDLSGHRGFNRRRSQVIGPDLIGGARYNLLSLRTPALIRRRSCDG